ncbi:MAG: FHA domain-containing protein [Kiritimatiellae bacterium]|nr:FHA domain-containing protein [Kiritimatiellia bacterium]
MIYRLIFLNGPRTGERITVTEQPMCAGADPDCIIHIEDPEVARRHAEIFQKGDELFIRDLGSMNKILVNKREVQDSRLKHGDEFELGRTKLVVQALVQAEVEGRSHTRRRRRQTTWALASLLLIGLVLALSARYIPRDSAEEIETSGLVPIPENTTTTTRTPPALPPALTEDIRTLREDLRVIQSAVKQLGVPPAPAPAGLPTLTPPPSPRTPRQEAEELIGAAREARTHGHPAEADRLLAHIQNLDPDYLPAYEERARLLEDQGQTGEAAAQWSEILRRSTESPLYQKAVAERIRLSRFHSPQPQMPQIKIASVQQTRFPATADYDEMRVLKIALQAENTFRLNPDDIQIEVSFYDRNPNTGDVAPSRGRIAQQTPELATEWGASEERVLTATCVIPKGMRKEQTAAGEPSAYYGYYLRLIYLDHKLDEAAQPRPLLAKAAISAEHKRPTRDTPVASSP